MEQNSVHITTEENIIVVIEPSGGTVTVFNNLDSSQVDSQNQVSQGTVVYQTTLTLNLDNLPNTVTVIDNRPPTNEVHVTQPLTTVLEIGQVGPRGLAGTSGTSGYNGTSGSSGTAGTPGTQ